MESVLIQSQTGLVVERPTGVLLVPDSRQCEHYPETAPPPALGFMAGITHFIEC